MTLEEYIIFQRFNIKGYALDTEEDNNLEEPNPNPEKVTK